MWVIPSGCEDIETQNNLNPRPLQQQLEDNLVNVVSHTGPSSVHAAGFEKNEEID